MRLKNKQKGFLLLEVLLALIILSAGIVAVVKTYSMGLRVQRHAENQTSAFLLASRLHEEIELGLIEDLRGEEVIGPGSFEWKIEIDSNPLNELTAVEVRVSWKERLREEEISLLNLYHKDILRN